MKYTLWWTNAMDLSIRRANGNDNLSFIEGLAIRKSALYPNLTYWIYEETASGRHLLKLFRNGAQVSRDAANN